MGASKFVDVPVERAFKLAFVFMEFYVVKERNKCERRARVSAGIALALSSIFALCALNVQAQTVAVAAPAAAADAEAMQRRVARARALAAAHNVTAATFELDAIRTSTTDDAIRDVARIMLVGLYLEQVDYGRAQNLLEETYKARSTQNEGSLRSYFAVAGRAVNGLRAHLERYRAFGLNIADQELPAEAKTDLDRLRSLLENVAAQAKEIGAGDDKNRDAFALLEDVASMRVVLSRNEEERARWQGEMTDSRQRLAASETRLASFSATAVAAAPPPVIVAASGKASPIGVSSTPSSQPVANNPEVIKQETAPATSTTAANSSPQPANGQPLNVGLLLDKATQRVSPTYPAFAKSARVAGIVRVELVIDEKGAVAAVQSSSGPEMLRQAAIDAAKRWRFRPTVKDGQPVRISGFLNFNFTL